MASCFFTTAGAGATYFPLAFFPFCNLSAGQRELAIYSGELEAIKLSIAEGLVKQNMVDFPVECYGILRSNQLNVHIGTYTDLKKQYW